MKSKPVLDCLNIKQRIGDQINNQLRACQSFQQGWILDQANGSFRGRTTKSRSKTNTNTLNTATKSLSCSETHKDLSDEKTVYVLEGTWENDSIV